MINKNAFLSILLFLILGCSINDITSIFEEKEVVLPGKRVNVFDFEDDIIVKANKRIQIDKPVEIKNWSQQFQNEKNHLFHFKSKKTLKLKRKLSLGDISLDRINLIAQPINDGINFYYADKNYNLISKQFTSGKLNWTVKLQNEKTEKVSFLG